ISDAQLRLAAQVVADGLCKVEQVLLALVLGVVGPVEQIEHVGRHDQVSALQRERLAQPDVDRAVPITPPVATPRTDAVGPVVVGPSPNRRYSRSPSPGDCAGAGAGSRR